MTVCTLLTQVVNKTVITWENSEPLRWTASTKVSDESSEYRDEFDLADLRQGFGTSFLLSLKELFVGRHRRVKHRTLKEEFDSLKRILRKIQAKQLTPQERLTDQASIAAVDIGLLTALRAKLVDEPNWISKDDLKRLKTLFKYAGDGAVFVGVAAGDFPTVTAGRSLEDLFRSRIVAQALSRSAQIAVFKSIEDGFQNLEIDLAVYVFWNLAHHLFIRPESYRQITCGDLVVHEDEVTKKRSFELRVMPAKRKSLLPKKMPTELDEQMGELLLLQRLSVVRENGPLYGIDPSTPIPERKMLEGRLAMFPRRSGTRKPFEIANFGVLESHSELSNNYTAPLQRRLQNIKVGFNVMRHTIGTHLAAAGCSAQTIQAVLKHATDQTARVYVDLATKELKKRLNEGLEGLQDIFPAYRAFTTQKEARTIPIRAINSANIDPTTGKLSETTPGQCGGTRACDYAPLSCYGCWRFIPSLDADHAMNAKLVQLSIDRHKQMGRSFVHLLERDEVIKLNIDFVIAQCNKQRQLESTQALAFQDA